MSRLDDLIDLIQTTNEVYFITAPGRVRTAFILVDDIIELALKTFLQEKALEQREQCQQALESTRLVTSNGHRAALRRYFVEDINRRSLGQSLGVGRNQPRSRLLTRTLRQYPLVQHWSANEPDIFRSYYEVVDEVKRFFTTGHPAIAFLDDALRRHQLRNRFYHDHQQTGLTIDDDRCLRALCGMFDLMEQLFPGTLTKDSFEFLARSNQVVRCQIGVLRLKMVAHGSPGVEEPYIRALKQFNNEHKVVYESRNYEHSVLHTISDRFFNAVRSHVSAEVLALEGKLTKKQREIDNYQRPETKAKHIPELEDIQHQLNLMRNHLQRIEQMLQ